MRKQKNIDISYQPLRPSGGIDVIGSVPSIQVYQADKSEYTPDYTIAPLVLFPRCNATDPSAIQVIGNINSKLTNVTWHESVGGVKTLITPSNTSYAITDSGAEKGKIIVKRNVATTKPVTLLFHGEYIDRSGQRIKFDYSHLIRAIDGTDAVPVVMIDSPSGGVDWNPIRDVDNQTINAKMIVGDKDVTDLDCCKFFFYRVLNNGALDPVNINGEYDFETVSIAKSQIVINRDYIGFEQKYVVKASYKAGGVAPDVPDESISPVSTVIRRKIPAISVDWGGLPTDVPLGTKFIYPKPIVMDTLGEIPNQEKFFKFSWYRTEKDGSLTLLSNARLPKLPYNGPTAITLDVQDLGPRCIVKTGTPPKVIRQAGKILTAKKLQP